MDRSRSWIRATALLWAVLVFAHVGLEWLFQVTKISFLSYLGALERLWVLALAPLPLVLAGWLLTIPAALPAALFAWAQARGLDLLERLLRPLARLPLASLPAMLLTATVFLLVDNFTVTLFGFGALTQRGPERWIYGVLLYCALGFVLLRVSDWIDALSRTRRLPTLTRAAGFLLGLSALAWLLLPWKDGYSLDPSDWASVQRSSELPDVFVVSAEALPAEAFQLYLDSHEENPGGEPTLSRLANEGAVFENVFANADRTAGSVPSVATGRHPLSSRKLNGRHSLRGADSYRHLPAILKQLGYRTYLKGPNFHVDPAEWNLRGGFDVHNDRPGRPGRLDALLESADGRLDWTAFFLELMWHRLHDRVLHSLGGDLVELPATPDVSERDEELFGGVLDLLRESDAPVFVMAHLRGDPAVLDNYLRYLLGLRQGVNAEPRDALVVFWSDHGPDHDARRRLPLILRLPEGSDVDAGSLELRRNAQNLDIPPTVLDALGVEVPEWMEGTSLLRSRSKLRPIVIVGSRDLDEGLPILGVSVGGPTRVMAMVCQRRWELDLMSGHLEIADLVDHSAPCDETDLPTGREVRERLLEFLRERGYQVDLVPDRSIGGSDEPVSES
ncbi:MAG: sulfatase-like hydrolase/transferase [Thermoanaerobaculia bacterium]|nr:sulfatase-like hydrolase/transferase [Thermoanaerobaculia bacterium]